MTKRTIKWIAIFLAIIAAVGAVGFASGLLVVDEDKSDEYFARKVNEDNLYSVSIIDLVDSNDGKGVAVDVNEKNGVIILDGTASQDLTFTVGEITLEAGTYTLTAIKGAGLNSVYMVADTATVDYNFDFTPANTITLTESTTFSLKINVAEGTELNNLQVMPVIVEGDEAADYFQ